MTNQVRMMSVLMAVCLGGLTGSAAEEAREGKAGFKKKSGDFAGPQSTVKQLEEDDAVKDPLFRFDWFDPALKPWFDLKGAFAEKSNISIGLAYTALYQESDVAPDGVDDVGASGILRLSGRWAATDTGTLVFSGDHRHAYDDQAPADLGFAVGYLGIPGTLFSDAEEVLVDFHWQQALNDGNSGLIVGRYDPNDFFDVLGYANPWTSFQNLAVLFNSSIALPDASIGIGGGHWLNDQMYVLGTINDANGVVPETDAFEGGSEFYKSIELGWTPSKDQRYFNKIHVMGWHADEREDAGLEESYGFTVSANRTWDQRCMVFAKLGWSDGAAPLANESVTLGFIHYIKKRSDLLGLAVNWSDPADDALEDQTVGELFYRLQFAQNLALTPAVQFVQDPALNDDEDQIVITSVRARLTL